MPLRRERAPKNELEEHFGFVSGCTSEAIGKERSAIAYYRNEIRRTLYYKAHFNLARLLAHRGRFTEAVTHYMEAVRRGVGRIFKSDALNNLGLAYSNKGLVAEAINAFRQSIRQNQQSAAPRVNLALELLRHGNRQKGRRALELARRLRRVEPEANKWVAYALIEYDLDARRGVGMLERTLANNPKDWGAMADLSVGYMKLGSYAKARTLARKAKRRAPEDRDVKKQVAVVLGRPK
jgi:tetratricopeptide (TPR) repeat protein